MGDFSSISKRAEKKTENTVELTWAKKWQLFSEGSIHDSLAGRFSPLCVKVAGTKNKTAD